MSPDETPASFLTDYGFTFGPAEVTRMAVFGQGHVVIGIRTAAGRKIEVYVSPAGRSLRVFRDGAELSAGPPPEGDRP